MLAMQRLNAGHKRKLELETLEKEKEREKEREKQERRNQLESSENSASTRRRAPAAAANATSGDSASIAGLLCSITPLYCPTSILFFLMLRMRGSIQDFVCLAMIDELILYS